MAIDDDMAMTTLPSPTSTNHSPLESKFHDFMQTLGGQVILITALMLALVIVFCWPLAQEIRRVFGQRYKYGGKKGVNAKDFELPKTGPFGIQMA